MFRLPPGSKTMIGPKMMFDIPKYKWYFKNVILYPWVRESWRFKTPVDPNRKWEGDFMERKWLPKTNLNPLCWSVLVSRKIFIIQFDLDKKLLWKSIQGTYRVTQQSKMEKKSQVLSAGKTFFHFWPYRALNFREPYKESIIGHF